MKKREERLEQFRAQVKAQREPLPRHSEQADLVVHEKDLAWFESAHNPTRLAPVLEAPMTTFELFLQEFEPGGSTDMQRHHHEAVHYVIFGRGYSEIGSRRYDWSTGDFVCVPPMMWHRHYNTNESEGAKMLIVENSRLLEHLGLNYRDSVGLLTSEQLASHMKSDGSTGGKE